MIENWRNQASCTEVGDLWFPPAGAGQNRWDGMSDVIAICETCPVRQACLEFALRCEEGQPRADRAGIYGGLTPRERSSIDLKSGPRHRGGYKHSQETLDEIKRLYQDGLMHREIADRLNLTRNQVSELISRYRFNDRRGPKKEAAA